MGRGELSFGVAERGWESRRLGHRGHRPVWTLFTLITAATALSPTPCPAHVLLGCPQHPFPPIQPVTLFPDQATLDPSPAPPACPFTPLLRGTGPCPQSHCLPVVPIRPVKALV